MFVATYDSRSKINGLCCDTCVLVCISMVQVSEGKSFQEEVVEQLPEDLRVYHSAVPDSAVLYVRTYTCGDIVFNSSKPVQGTGYVCITWLMQCSLL